jgi:gliding motility-associated-like protein
VRRFLLFFIFFSGVTAALAQVTTSRLGRFRVDQVKGCAPFTVTITDTNLVTTGECTPGKPCLMDQGNGTSSTTNQFTFTYATPGTYKLSVLYQSIGEDDIGITVTENIVPAFEVYTCTGNAVSIKVTDKSYDTYIIDFNNDNTPETTIPSGNNAVAQHSYAAAGTYTIAVRGRNVNSANNCQIKTESYQTLAVLPTPSINVMTAVDANNLKLDMTTAPHIQYRLEIAQNNSSTFQPYQNLYQVNTVTIPNLLVDNNYYCFRLSAFDPCAGTNTYSNTICSHDFDVAFENGVNDLNWRISNTGITTTQINRNGVSYSSIPGAPPGFQDNDYDCNKEYCYQVVSLYAGGRRSISLQKCGTGILTTTFPPIEDVSTVVRAGVELLWTADPTIDIKNFDIWKSTPAGPLQFFALTDEQLYIDPTYDYQGNICYQVNYSDFCDNKSAPGIIACPIALTGSLDDKNAATLTWNAYRGWKDGVSTYQVNKYTSAGALITTFTTNDTTYVDYDPSDEVQIVIYSITAIPIVGGVDKRSVSNQVKLEKEAKLLLPTAFTPNGDGVNPLFTISGKFVSKMSIQIFDRWGALVFSSDKNEPWDGTRGGKVMPESAYVWKAEVVDFAGHTFSREGTVLLLRPPR